MLVIRHMWNMYGGNGGVDMDRRVRKSREALKGALLELLSRQSLNEIQVKQLCEAADVNRSD